MLATSPTPAFVRKSAIKSRGTMHCRTSGLGACTKGNGGTWQASRKASSRVVYWPRYTFCLHCPASYHPNLLCRRSRSSSHHHPPWKIKKMCQTASIDDDIEHVGLGHQDDQTMDRCMGWITMSHRVPLHISQHRCATTQSFHLSIRLTSP